MKLGEISNNLIPDCIMLIFSAGKSSKNCSIIVEVHQKISVFAELKSSRRKRAIAKY